MNEPQPQAKSFSFEPKDWGMLFLLALFWGWSFLFNAVALEEMSPFEVAFARVSFAALTLLVIHRIRRMPWPRSGSFWLKIAVMGLVNNVIPFSLVLIGQTVIGSALAAILNATTPIFATLIAHFSTADEKLSRIKTLGILVGFLGVALMMVEGLLLSSNLIPDDGISPLLARLAGLSAAVSYGVAAVWGRNFKDFPTLTTATGQLVVSTLMMFVIAILIDQTPELLSLSGASWLAIFFLAVPSTALAYLLFFSLLKRVGAGNVALVTFLVPAFATLFGIFIRSEVLSAYQVVGLILIALSFVIIDPQLRAKLFRVGRDKRE